MADKGLTVTPVLKEVRIGADSMFSGSLWGRKKWNSACLDFGLICKSSLCLSVNSGLNLNPGFHLYETCRNSDELRLSQLPWIPHVSHLYVNSAHLPMMSWGLIKTQLCPCSLSLQGTMLFCQPYSSRGTAVSLLKGPRQKNVLPCSSSQCRLLHCTLFHSRDTRACLSINNSEQVNLMPVARTQGPWTDFTSGRVKKQS